MEERRSYCSFKQMSLQGEERHFIDQKDGSFLVDAASESAQYISERIDSGSDQMEWDTLHLDMSREADLKLTVWMTDDDKKSRELMELPFEDRLSVLNQIGVFYDTQDVLLHSTAVSKKGRYLIFALSVRASLDSIVCWRGFRLYFPAVRFSEYLPPIYQGNDMLDRYLSVFQTLYLAFEEQIDTFHQELHPMSASETHVDALLDWLGIAHYGRQFTIEKKRELLLFYQRQVQYRGTKRYYEAMVDFLFDCRLRLKQTETTAIAVLDREDEHAAAFLKQELPFYMQLEIQTPAPADELGVLDHTCLDQDISFG